MDKAKFIEIAKALLRKCGNPEQAVAAPARLQFAKAINTPIREGVMAGDVTGGIFTPELIDRGVTAKYPLDPISPGTEKDFVAFSIPKTGYIPQRHVDGDEVHLPMYKVGNAMSWDLDYAENARWPVVQRLLNVYRAGYTKKLNDDAYHLLLMAAVDRNILAFDSDANIGQFTKRLVSLLQVTMARNAGGNSASEKQGSLTDLYMSPEGQMDIRNWGIDQIDEITRREVITTEGGLLTRIFGVTLHVLRELGEGQEYQLYFQNDLSGTMGTSDLEIVIGLDLSTNDSFVMPVGAPGIQTFDDPILHREQRQGVYGWGFAGFGCLDNRRILLGSY